MVRAWMPQDASGCPCKSAPDSRDYGDYVRELTGCRSANARTNLSERKNHQTIKPGLKAPKAADIIIIRIGSAKTGPGEARLRN
jgi:hypothetical protein